MKMEEASFVKVCIFNLIGLNFLLVFRCMFLTLEVRQQDIYMLQMFMIDPLLENFPHAQTP